MSAGDAPAPTRGDISSVVAVTGQRQGAFSERASQVALVVKDPPANAGDKTDVGSVPGSGRSPGGGHSNPLQEFATVSPGATMTILQASKSQAKS